MYVPRTTAPTLLQKFDGTGLWVLQVTAIIATAGIYHWWRTR